MEVSALKAERKGLRTAFSLSLKKIETKLMKENIDMNQLLILKTQFMDKFQKLDTCQNLVSKQLLELKDAAQEYLDDMEDAENDRDHYIEMCSRIDLKIRETVAPTETENRKSCLPEEILVAWERKRNAETDAKGSRTLEHLMTFLRLEVLGKEMVQLAKSGFGTPI
ncbi:uncharacterized protein TNIN_30531 [Trichonephila inaurata madagascariensis]|uniref:Uncharacterized protein n=1 Tax=Trichonephila inaurata madagascariensis TaxID=2747483 RepID=A0A8X7BZS4_9ARAC|nr:uncharacterized protein TNIN_30531 [Trichonephila inaurata madagascariensis]